MLSRSSVNVLSFMIKRCATAVFWEPQASFVSIKKKHLIAREKFREKLNFSLARFNFSLALEKAPQIPPERGPHLKFPPWVGLASTVGWRCRHLTLIFVFRGWFATQILARCGLCNAGLLAVFTVKSDKKSVDFASVVQNWIFESGWVGFIFSAVLSCDWNLVSVRSFTNVLVRQGRANLNFLECRHWKNALAKRSICSQWSS